MVQIQHTTYGSVCVYLNSSHFSFREIQPSVSGLLHSWQKTASLYTFQFSVFSFRSEYIHFILKSDFRDIKKRTKQAQIERVK